MPSESAKAARFLERLHEPRNTTRKSSTFLDMFVVRISGIKPLRSMLLKRNREERVRNEHCRINVS